MAIKAAQREGKRHPLSLRVTAEVRRGLETVASASGRSLTQEAELRLEQTFARDRAAGSQANRALGDAIVSALSISEVFRGRAWTSSREEARYTFGRLVLALGRAMEVEPVLEKIENERDRIDAEAWMMAAMSDDFIDQLMRNPPEHYEPEVLEGPRMPRAVFERLLAIRKQERSSTDVAPGHKDADAEPAPAKARPARKTKA